MRLRVTNDSALGDFMLRAREQGQSTRHRLGSGLAADLPAVYLYGATHVPAILVQLHQCNEQSFCMRGPAALPALTFLDLNSCLILSFRPQPLWPVPDRTCHIYLSPASSSRAALLCARERSTPAPP